MGVELWTCSRAPRRGLAFDLADEFEPRHWSAFSVHPAVGPWKLEVIERQFRELWETFRDDVDLVAVSVRAWNADAVALEVTAAPSSAGAGGATLLGGGAAGSGGGGRAPSGVPSGGGSD